MNIMRSNGRIIMEENIKRYSDMERYELINVNDGDKYGF